MPHTSIAVANGIVAKYFENAREKLYRPGELVISADTHPHEVYYIVSGFIKGYTISDDGSYSLLIIKTTADLIPMATLFSKDHNDLYYETMTEVRVKRMLKTEFEEALTDSSELTMATLHKSVDYLRVYTQRMHNLNITDARPRIICRLLSLQDRFGVEEVAGHEVISVPITYPDLANSLNLTRETVNRVVSQLISEGLVSKTHSRVGILDIKKLEAEQGVI